MMTKEDREAAKIAKRARMQLVNHYRHQIYQYESLDRFCRYSTVFDSLIQDMVKDEKFAAEMLSAIRMIGVSDRVNAEKRRFRIKVRSAFLKIKNKISAALNCTIFRWSDRGSFSYYFDKFAKK